jgi:hypothetical protein
VSKTKKDNKILKRQRTVKKYMDLIFPRIRSPLELKRLLCEWIYQIEKVFFGSVDGKFSDCLPEVNYLAFLQELRYKSITQYRTCSGWFVKQKACNIRWLNIRMAGERRRYAILIISTISIFSATAIFR